MPSTGVGGTAMVTAKATPCSVASPMSTSGDSRGSTPVSTSASRYQSLSARSSVWANMPSRPTRWITTPAGTLPGRKPGSRMRAEVSLTVRSNCLRTSSSGTVTSMRTLSPSRVVSSAATGMSSRGSWVVGRVRVRGLEPPRVSPPGPKPGASTGSATPARVETADRVSDGTRTHDRLDHNQELYRLSYAHHDPDRSPAPGEDSGRAPSGLPHQRQPSRNAARWRRVAGSSGFHPRRGA